MSISSTAFFPGQPMPPSPRPDHLRRDLRLRRMAGERLCHAIPPGKKPGRRPAIAQKLCRPDPVNRFCVKRVTAGRRRPALPQNSRGAPLEFGHFGRADLPETVCLRPTGSGSRCDLAGQANPEGIAITQPRVASNELPWVDVRCTQGSSPPAFAALRRGKSQPWAERYNPFGIGF